MILSMTLVPSGISVGSWRLPSAAVFSGVRLFGLASGQTTTSASAIGCPASFLTTTDDAADAATPPSNWTGAELALFLANASAVLVAPALGVDIRILLARSTR